MAILQRTLASGSIWIGTSSSAQDWSAYDNAHHYPLAIYKNADSVFNFNTEGTTNILELNTTSIRSANYISGFDPTNQGNRGFAIDLINNRYVAEFDDLWVRGTMNVHLFVINQIRATNGSLWVSDAAKATSADHAGEFLLLYFETNSVLPFVLGDIIRSKRWVINQTTIDNWDFVGVIDDIDYEKCRVAIDILNPNNYWSAGNEESTIDVIVNAASSEWVRIGNISDTNRQGGIYLTAGDNQSPYIDIYDSVSTVAGGHYNDSGSVNYIDQDILKVRLGRLSGINSLTFGNLQGYGLYSLNVYLKGTISATAGTFSAYLQSPLGLIGGWTIGATSLYSGLITISSDPTNRYFGIGASGYNTASSIYLGSNSAGQQFSIRGTGETGLYWDGSNLGVSSSNFTLSNGQITATAGKLANWDIYSKYIYGTGNNSNISIRTLTSSNWNIISKSGVSYETLIEYDLLYHISKSLFDTNVTYFNCYENAVLSFGGDILTILFSSSIQTNGKIFARSKDSIYVPAETTVYFGFKSLSIDSSFVTSLHSDTLGMQLVDLTTTTTKSDIRLFYPGSPYSTNDLFFSYTNLSGTLLNLYILLNLKSTKTGSVLPSTYSLNFGALAIATASGYTELSPNGLLVWAGPSNYIKLTTDGKKQYAVAAFDLIYVGGLLLDPKGGGGGGGTSGVDGSGTGDTIPIWTDANTIGDSIITQQNNATISVAGTVSATAFSGSGFVFEDVTSTYNAKVGNLPVGYNADNKSIKLILNDMLFFAAPTLTLTTNLTKTMQASDTAETTLTDIGVTKLAPFKISSGARLATTFSCGANYRSVNSLKMETKSSDLGGINLDTTITPATSTYLYYYDLGSEKQFTDADSEIAYAKISGTDTLGGTLTSVTDTLTLYVGLRFVLAYTDGTNWWFKSILGTGTSVSPFTASTTNYLTFQQAFSNSVVTTTAPSRLKNTYNDGSTLYCFNANLWTNMPAGQTCLLMVATRNDHPATTILWWNGAVWVGQPSVNSNGVTTTANSTALVGATTYTWPQGTASTATGGYTYSLAFANGLARNEKCWVINAKDSAVSGTQKYRFN